MISFIVTPMWLVKMPDDSSTLTMTMTCFHFLLQELEKMIRRKDRTSFELERKLGLMELRLDDEVCEAREQLSSAVSQNSALMNKVRHSSRTCDDTLAPWVACNKICNCCFS